MLGHGHLSHIHVVEMLNFSQILFSKFVETDQVGDRWYTFSGIDKVEESIDMQATRTNLHVYMCLAPCRFGRFTGHFFFIYEKFFSRMKKLTFFLIYECINRFTLGMRKAYLLLHILHL